MLSRIQSNRGYSLILKQNSFAAAGDAFGKSGEMHLSETGLRQTTSLCELQLSQKQDSPESTVRLSPGRLD